MKTKYLVAILAAFTAILVVASILIFRPSNAAMYAEIKSNGRVLRTVSLSEESEFTVSLSDGNYNIIRVHDGKISVVDASCPDHYCMAYGSRDGGAPIVCLPNGLVISFLGDSDVDGAVG